MITQFRALSAGNHKIQRETKRDFEINNVVKEVGI
jgi:hypothetical protein